MLTRDKKPALPDYYLALVGEPLPLVIPCPSGRNDCPSGCDKCPVDELPAATPTIQEGGQSHE